MILVSIITALLTLLRQGIVGLLNRPYSVSHVSFFRKEFFGALRQPRLIFSLVVGPFLILAAFGLGYNGPGRYSTILVVPDQPGFSTKVADYQDIIKQSFELKGVTKNLGQARAALNKGETEVVIVVPPNALDEIYNGHSALFPVYYRSLSPVDAGYIEYASYIYATEFDKVILRESFKASKPQASQLQDSSHQIAIITDALDNSMQSGNLVEAKIQVRALRLVVELTRKSLDSLILPGAGTSDTTQRKLLGTQIVSVIFKSGVTQIRNDLDNIDQQLNQMEAGFNRGDLNSPAQRARLEKIRSSNASLGERANKIATIPPAVLVEPVRSEAQNVISTEVNYINFYSPAVVILLLQHIAITLSSLSNVRDHQLGTIEVFRVAPISPTQILTGKFISFTLLLLTLGFILVASITLLLGVPFIDFQLNWLVGLMVLLLTVYASIGLGFMVSGLSRTESQAVQFSMIILLGSIFFTGFILPLNQFGVYVKFISYVLPVTFGASSLQNVMLDKQPLEMINLIILFGLGTIYMVIGWLLYQRQFRDAH